MKPAKFWIVSCFVMALAYPEFLAAQTYPTRTIRLILPFGVQQVIYQLLARSLTEALGQPVVIDYKPGHGGHIGAEAAAKSPPDGYTLVILSSSHSNGPSLYKNLKYDVLKDFAAISLIARVDNVLVVHSSLPAKSLKELAQLARTQPGKLMYGSGGVGSSGHLGIELFKSLARVDITHIPYKGGASVLPNILSGEVNMVSVTLPPAIPYINSGKLRALAVLARDRAPTLPEVPTTAEAGMPDLVNFSWYGVAVPAGVRPGIIEQLHAAIVSSMHTPEMKQRLAPEGVEPLTSTPAEFSEFIRSETTRWAQVIKDANIKF